MILGATLFSSHIQSLQILIGLVPQIDSRSCFPCSVLAQVPVTPSLHGPFQKSCSSPCRFHLPDAGALTAGTRSVLPQPPLLLSATGSLLQSLATCSAQAFCPVLAPPSAYADGSFCIQSGSPTRKHSLPHLRLFLSIALVDIPHIYFSVYCLFPVPEHKVSKVGVWGPFQWCHTCTCAVHLAHGRCSTNVLQVIIWSKSKVPNTFLNDVG